MTDTVLQSFCERCGARYTYTEQEQKPDGSRSKLGRLGRRTAADPSAEPTVSTTLPTSERFDGTFHFCLECRQYACTDCWNSSAGYCVGCRPQDGTEIDPDPPVTRPSMSPTVAAGGTRTDIGAVPSAWPTGDLKRSAAIATDEHHHDHTHPPVDPGPDAPGDLAGSTPARERSSGQDEARRMFARDDDSVDEWGRPLTERPTPQPASPATDLPFDISRPAADPWQDIVFSESGASTPPSTPRPIDVPSREPDGVRPPTSTATPPGTTRADTGVAPTPERGPSVSTSWPAADSGRSADTPPTPASKPGEATWPDRDRKGDDPTDEQTAASRPGATSQEPDKLVDVQGQARSGSRPASSATRPDAVRPQPSDVGEVEIESVEAGDIAESTSIIGATPATAPMQPDVQLEVSRSAVPEAEPPSAAQRILGMGAIAAGAVGVSGDAAAEPVAGPARTSGAADDSGIGPPPTASHPPAALTPIVPAAPTPIVPAAPTPTAAATPPTIGPVAHVNATLSFAEPEEHEADPHNVHASSTGAAQAAPGRPLAQAPNPMAAATTTPPSASAAPLRPLPTGTTLRPVAPMAGPFAEPYQRPADRPPMPLPQTRTSDLGAGTPPAPAVASPASVLPPGRTPPRSAPPLPPQVTTQAAAQARHAHPTAAVAWMQPGDGLPPQPQTPQQPASGPEVMAPPRSSAPPLPPMPVAAKRTASQGCANCGLPLSAKARFCRRCGAAQP